MTMNYEMGNNGLQTVVHSFPATLAFGQGSDKALVSVVRPRTVRDST